MSADSGRRLHRTVIGLWGLALGFGLLLLLNWFWKDRATLADLLPSLRTNTPTASLTPTFTRTGTATRTLTSTKTLTPSRTLTPSLSPTPTWTPVPFSEGPIVIGKSVQGRPLEVYRFGTGDVERLIVAGMHGGNEYNTVQLVDELMAYLKDHPRTIPQDVTLYFLRALNPDGIARSLSYLGRANAHEVDLNRNWPDGWKKDWDRTGCWIATNVTGGKKPASEPETQALMAFIEAHQFSGLINYHSAALGVFAGGVPPTDASKQLAQAIAAVSTYRYPPYDTGCEYTGGMVDWTADIGIPSVDLELTNHSGTDFDMNLKILQTFLSWPADQ